MDELLRKLDDISIKVEAISNQIGMLHDVAVSGNNDLGEYVLSIWLIHDNAFFVTKELQNTVAALFKERTK